ncbi:MAG: bifunctional glutamate N-acetyltransferase/amino-acid acetyltransferase ArgJ [Rhodospirillales bacterium]|nr:bifunctional glutamate N-acetyltransferase/amino-acid acetyltransferase ArgJ [Rhodospirillales bacterium]
MTDKSPLAPDRFPEMPAVPGVKFAPVSCGLKKDGALDLLFVSLPEATDVAGVFTDSAMSSPTIDWDRDVLNSGHARGLVINSANANSFTGKAGVAVVEATAAAAGDVLGCAPGDVMISSTGVIGEQLPVEKITNALPGLNPEEGASWEDAALAISTTDTFPKGASRQVELDGTSVTIAGIAKGSGMIAPHMATMLAYVFTDAAISHGVLQHLLQNAVNRSFNNISVDSDRSTNDTVLLFATGRAEHKWVAQAGDAHLRDFRGALDEVCLDLAHQIVRDGEGAAKFIEITVTGAEDDRAAKAVGRAIADSPLVKTAIAGEDANWGRIVMAVGKAGEAADRDRLAITIGGIAVARDGVAVDGYDEAPVAAHMKGDEIGIEVDLGVGSGRATVWTCDLTHGYISINADYRT